MMASRNDLGRRAFLAGAAAVAAAPVGVKAADSTSVTVGIPPGYMGAIVDYAQDRGFFKAAGLEVRSTVMNSGAVIASAVTGGSLDFGAVNVGSLVSARLRGVPLRIVAPASFVPAGPYGDVAMVRKDSPIRTAADFNGKTVAIVALKTIQNAAFLAWLDKRGGDAKSVRMFEMPLPEMGAVLESGRVDAAITVEPFTTRFRANNRDFGSVYDAMQLPFMVFAICATDQWIQANTATATKFASAIRQAAVWANGHEKECRALLATTMKLEPQVANAMLMPLSGTSVEPAMIQPVIDVMVKYGFLEKPYPPSEMIWRTTG
jgi:NitT/TauT family transport system substrate-binding protein